MPGRRRICFHLTVFLAGCCFVAQRHKEEWVHNFSITTHPRRQLRDNPNEELSIKFKNHFHLIVFDVFLIGDNNFKTSLKPRKLSIKPLSDQLRGGFIISRETLEIIISGYNHGRHLSAASRGLRCSSSCETVEIEQFIFYDIDTIMSLHGSKSPLREGC